MKKIILMQKLQKSEEVSTVVSVVYVCMYHVCINIIYIYIYTYNLLQLYTQYVYIYIYIYCGTLKYTDYQPLADSQERLKPHETYRLSTVLRPRQLRVTPTTTTERRRLGKSFFRLAPICGKTAEGGGPEPCIPSPQAGLITGAASENH